MTEKLVPPRVVGILGASLLNINGMIGAGIFALPALLYVGVGNFAPLAILLFAIPTACLALVVAKMSTLFDESGGMQLYIETALGKFTGFEVGWFVFCSSIVGRAASLHVLVSYLAALFPIFEGPIARPFTIIGTIVFITVLTVVGTRRAVAGIWVGTVLKLTPLILLVFFGLGMNGIPTDIELPVVSGLESVALIIAYAFSGFATSAIAAGETKNPKSTIFRSIVFALAGTAIAYAAIQWAYIAIGPEVTTAGTADDAPLATAAQKMFGEWAAAIISVAAVFSIATNQLAGFIVYPRLLFGMAERGQLPRFLAHISERFLTPDNAILLFGLVMTVIAASGSFTLLASLLVAIEQVVFALLLLGFVVLWKRNFRGMKDKTGLIWLAIFSIATALVVWLSLQLSLSAVIPTLAMIAIGAAFFALAHSPLWSSALD